jgi:hypothetical protein
VCALLCLGLLVCLDVSSTVGADPPKLTQLAETRQQLATDIETYDRQQKELDETEAVWQAEMRKARVSVVAWARAHKRMAQGVIDPANIDVLGIARKASGAVAPIP